VILGYPCNQFGKQEPYGTPEELMNGIRWVRPGGGFEPMLDYMFERVDVNGENEIPLYTFLKGTCGPTFTQFSKSHNLFYEPLRTGDIAWNFEKFLVNRQGKPVRRYHPRLVAADDIDMVRDIEAVIAEAPVAQETDVPQQERQTRLLEWNISPQLKLPSVQEA